MKVYKVPFDIKREEKIFGGYLSLRQVTYVIFAFHIPTAIKIIIVMLFASFFLLCAFLRIGEQNFDRFFFYALKYLFRKKDYVYRRCNI